MKRVVLSIFIIVLFCFPYSYYAMLTDYKHSSMIGYVVFIVATALLTGIGNLTKCLPAVLIGTFASACISYYFLGVHGESGRWDGYFKPFGSNGVIVIVTILNLIPQFIAFKVTSHWKKKINDKKTAL
ncbi:hypothetical protein U8V72_15285 [Priestia filamentosa]|uniref:hypothetical protein n=1 Tax=Priestia filamentosa TaxID=1402861 RepID=UPI000691C0F7